MTIEDLAAKAAAESAARTKAFDEETLLAAESFSFGVFDHYVNAKVADIERRINDRYGYSGTTPSSAELADPAELGKPVA